MTKHNRTYHADSACEDIIGLVGAYAIGATTPEETRAVEALLPDCPQAMAELAHYMAVSDAMLHVLPMDKEPPADLLHGLSPGDTAPLHSMHAMPPATAHTNGTPLPQHAHTPQPQVTVLPQPQERRTPWLALAGIAAAFLLIIGMNVVWFSLYRGLQTQQTQITSLIEQQAQVIANMDAVPPAAPIVVAGNTHSISLQPNIPDAEFVNARIVYDAQSNIGSVWADNLPQPTAGHGYQVWLVRGEEVVSLGTFSVTIGGEGSLLFRSPVPITPDDVLGISTEPVSGSQEPTTPHLVTGKIDT